MHVGLEVTTVLARRFTGVQRYVTEFSRALFELAPADVRCSLLLRLADFRKRELLPQNPWPARWYCSGPWPALPRCDVIHGLDVRLPVVWGRRTACVATVHDLSPFTLPNFGSERALRNTQERYRAAAKRADRIIAISGSTKTDFAKLLDYPPERIDVVHHGLSPAFLAPGAEADGGVNIDRPYFVAFAGTPRKNLPRLVRALAGSARRDADLRIVGPADEGTRRAIADTQLAARVQFELQLDEAALRRLYRRSCGLLYPSLLEGFGFPILEAMASRVPVLTSLRSGTEEIAGGHAVLVEPLSVDSIAAGIDRLDGVAAPALESAATHASTFTWQRAAEQTLEVYWRLA